MATTSIEKTSSMLVSLFASASVFWLSLILLGLGTQIGWLAAIGIAVAVSMICFLGLRFVHVLRRRACDRLAKDIGGRAEAAASHETY